MTRHDRVVVQKSDKYFIDAFGFGRSITTQELAENFTVSVRTIKYDLEDIRAWFEQHDETLYSKRNKGIWLDLPDSKRLLLKMKLSMSIDLKPILIKKTSQCIDFSAIVSQRLLNGTAASR